MSDRRISTAETLREVIARALHVAQAERAPDQGVQAWRLSQPIDSLNYANADALLTALRSWEPSEEVSYLAAQQIKTSYENENSMVDGASAVWRAMLDAAIKEGRDGAV